MRYYFFKTTTELEDGIPTIRIYPLPGQTFGDGTPIDETIRVHGPKEANEAPGGARNEYPAGTVFCSTKCYLKTGSKGGQTYHVFDKNNKTDFNVVSDDPNFNYVKPEHKNDNMNAAYVAFTVFGVQTDDTEDDDTPIETDAKAAKPAVNYSPVLKGKARGPIEGWIPAYDDQVESQSDLICTWITRFMVQNGMLMMAVRPKVNDSTRPLFNYLYQCGENIDTIASRVRFKKIMDKEKMDFLGLATISTGPLAWYLSQLKQEHERSGSYSGTKHNPANDEELADAMQIICTEMNRLTGSVQIPDDNLKKNISVAMTNGWEIQDIINPEILCSRDTAQHLVTDMVTGVIPLPEKSGDADDAPTLLEMLEANPKYSKPADKDGFHVSELVWKILICNLAAHKNTLIKGPTGCGKSELVKLLCEKTGTPYTFIPMGNITDPTEQLVGKLDLDPATGGTKFDWADFALAVQRPGLVLLDEINRIPRNGGNTLLSVLQERVLPAASAKGADNRMIKVHPECVFFATANIGAEYTGTAEIDGAIDNRFMKLELGYMDIKDEIKILCTRTGISNKDANNICIVAEGIRLKNREGTLQHGVSTRETLLCAEYVKFGFSVEQALQFIFLPIFEGGVSDADPDCERASVKAIIAQRLKASTKKDKNE